MAQPRTPGRTGVSRGGRRRQVCREKGQSGRVARGRHLAWASRQRMISRLPERRTTWPTRSAGTEERRHGGGHGGRSGRMGGQIGLQGDGALDDPRCAGSMAPREAHRAGTGQVRSRHESVDGDIEASRPERENVKQGHAGRKGAPLQIVATPTVPPSPRCGQGAPRSKQIERAGSRKHATGVRSFAATVVHVPPRCQMAVLSPKSAKRFAN